MNASQVVALKEPGNKYVIMRRGQRIGIVALCGCEWKATCLFNHRRFIVPRGFDSMRAAVNSILSTHAMVNAKSKENLVPA